MDSFNNATLLVVDDEPDLRDMLALEFQRLGSRVLKANDGAQALELTRQTAVDVIVTDVRMPNTDGIELLAALRQQSPSRPALIFITAYNLYLTAPVALDLGAEEIFTKPFNLKILIDRVRHALKPAADKWRNPSPVPPAHRMVCHFPDMETAMEDDLLYLGRGGIALRTNDRVSTEGGYVTLDITFDAGLVRAIQGTARVRWVRVNHNNTDYFYGLEFDYLEPESHKAILARIEQIQCPAFIPNP